MKSSKGKVLLVPDSGLVKNASTIDQHLSSFIKYIDAPIFSIDTAFNSNSKLIKKLSRNDFSHIILHYSLFGYQPFGIPKFLFDFLQNLSGKKIAFFQDENQSCLEYRYINELGIDTIFSTFISIIIKKHILIIQIVKKFSAPLQDMLMKIL